MSVLPNNCYQIFVFPFTMLRVISLRINPWGRSINSVTSIFINRRKTITTKVYNAKAILKAIGISSVATIASWVIQRLVHSLLVAVNTWAIPLLNLSSCVSHLTALTRLVLRNGWSCTVTWAVILFSLWICNVNTTARVCIKSLIGQCQILILAKLGNTTTIN